MEGIEMRVKIIFLALLTIVALTFPGMSVCATELQTDKTESGEEEISKSVVDYFYNNDIFYYNPENTEADNVEGQELIAQLIKENLTQKQQILDMEDTLQFEKEQITSMQERMNLLGASIALLLIVLSADLGYHVCARVSNYRARHKTVRVEEQGVTLETGKARNG